MLGDAFGGLQRGYFALTVIIVAIRWAGQLFTLFGVKEVQIVGAQKSTPLRELLSVIVKNDQLLYTAICMTLFMIGYMTTTTFGLYFFKYAYGDENMYSVFAIVLGVSQITALAVFPLLSKKWNRRTLYQAAIVLVTVGYIAFFFSPTSTMLFIGISGTLLFVGQAFIQLLMLMFLADSVDYGHYKLGKRNDSISFSLQPFINKLSGAVGNGVVGAVIVVVGIKDAETALDVTEGGLLLMKIAMLVFPLVCIVVSFLVYRGRYKIDEKMHAEVVRGLVERGELDAGEVGAGEVDVARK
jgi:melibiose permease/lactose/raffinose/galactose permease